MSNADQAFEGVQGQYDLLNDLLAKAKTTLVVWREWEAHPEGWQRGGWQALYRANNLAWDAVIQVVGSMPKPIFFTGEDGKERSIGTVGSIDGGLMLRYSEDVGARFAIAGYALDRIQHFGAQKSQCLN